MFKSIVKSNPVIHRLACRTQRELITLRAHADQIRNRFRYLVPVRPFELLQIDPNCIDLMLVEPFDNRRFRNLSPVISGEWDQRTKSLHDYDLFYSVYNHFKYNTSWEDTDIYLRVRNEIKNTTDWRKWGCTNFGEFKTRLRALDDLHDLIEKDGYRTQREIEKTDTDPIKTRPCLPPEWHEITVHIGRDGEFIFHEGRHRLAISQAIGLDSVPVRVMVRHEEWQSLRDRVYKRTTTINSDIPRHPDLIRNQSNGF